MVNLDYLKNLNDAQKEAVTTLNGPLLIVAGAGSGKTKVLTSRIAHIIKTKNALPNQILEPARHSSSIESTHTILIWCIS